MTEADHDFDPSTMPRIAHADPSLPGTLELGVFSLSLTVADLAASRAFYEALGFEVTGGDAHGGWLILKNGETTLGLFAGMFDRNMLTFNPGMTARMERLDSFTDIRDLEVALRNAGLSPESAIQPGSTGAGSITLVDPDGNPVLIDQFFDASVLPRAIPDDLIDGFLDPRPITLTWPRTAIGAGHSLDRPRSSGGTWGHEQYVAAVTAPTHPEHAEMVE